MFDTADAARSTGPMTRGDYAVEDQVAADHATGQTATIEEVWELLDAADSGGIDEEAKYLVAAALEGDDAFDAQLGGQGSAVARPDAAPGRTASPIKAFIQSLTVAGFRGIGPDAELQLVPAPGLTVVSGRNGSGKSSFSEALECAVTGTSYRWTGKNQKIWQDGWRNLHRGAQTRVAVGLVQQPDADDAPPSTSPSRSNGRASR